MRMSFVQMLFELSISLYIYNSVDCSKFFLTVFCLIEKYRHCLYVVEMISKQLRFIVDNEHLLTSR